MKNEIIYELPEEKGGLIEIIDSIPSNWSWIDGGLTPTKQLYGIDKIAKNTRLRISRWYSIKPTIIGVDNVPFEEERGLRERKEFVIPDLFGALCEGKLFSSVHFDEAGFETPEISIGIVKKFVRYFLELGYKGWISAYSGYRNNHKYDNPERFHFSHYHQGTSVFGPELPPHISLEWEEEYSGKKENLSQIIKKISSLNLKEIKLKGGGKWKNS